MYVIVIYKYINTNNNSLNQFEIKLTILFNFYNNMNIIYRFKKIKGVLVYFSA